jgi:hypothetical protein
METSVCSSTFFLLHTRTRLLTEISFLHHMWHRFYAAENFDCQTFSSSSSAFNSSHQSLRLWSSTHMRAAALTCNSIIETQRVHARNTKFMLHRGEDVNLIGQQQSLENSLQSWCDKWEEWREDWKKTRPSGSILRLEQHNVSREWVGAAERESEWVWEKQQNIYTRRRVNDPA